MNNLYINFLTASAVEACATFVMIDLTSLEFGGVLFMSLGTIALLWVAVLGRYEGKSNRFFITCFTYEDKEFQGLARAIWLAGWVCAICGSFMATIDHLDLSDNALAFVLQFVSNLIWVYLISRLVFLIVIIIHGIYRWIKG